MLKRVLEEDVTNIYESKNCVRNAEGYGVVFYNENWFEQRGSGVINK